MNSALLEKVIFKFINYFRLGFIYRVLTGKVYQQIIICGIPRSGTSLAYNLFNSALCGFEPYVKKKRNNSKSKETSGCKAIFRPGNYITKLPNDLFNIDRLNNRNILDKQILIVVITRDFRDVITSKHQWGDGSYYIGYNYKKTTSGNIQYNRGLKNYITKIKEIKNRKESNIEFVDYSEMVNKPSIIIDLLDQHGFKNKGYRFLEDFESVYDSTEKSSKGIKKKYSKKWQMSDHKQRVIGQFSENPALFEFLKEFGYESNNEWYEALINQGDLKD